MDLSVLGFFLIAGCAVAWLASWMPDPGQSFSGIFGFREARWPSGVQEDDDAHWSWARVTRDRPEPLEIIDTAAPEADRYRPDDPEAGAQDEVSGSYEIRAAVKGHVRSAANRTRS